MAGIRTIPAGAGIGPPGAGAIPAGRCTTTRLGASHWRPSRSAQLTMGVALALFLLSPVTLLAWAAGQAWLRITGMRWWKLALAALAAVALAILVEGGRGRPCPPLLRLHQLAAPDRRRPPRLRGIPVAPAPLAIPVGLLAAALNLAGRRQAIDPAEVRKQQRGHPAHGHRRPPGHSRTGRPLRPRRPRYRSTATSAGPTSTASWWCPGSCRTAPG